MNETDISRTICDYLALRQKQGKLYFWRNNNTPVYSVRRQSYMKMPKYTPKGLPDICVIKDGFFIGLEVKSGKGRQSEDQKEIEENLKKVGAEYYVVRNLETIKEIGL